jgi:hypothetical protein
MISEGQVIGNWLKHTRITCRRYQDPGLSALLWAQLVLIFVAEPLALHGIALPAAGTLIIIVGLILLLVLGSQQHGELVVVAVAIIVRLLTEAVDIAWGASVTEGAVATSSMLAALAVLWTVSRVVFGPGRITAHRVRGAVVLYLTTAILFAWLYRLIAAVDPDAFSGLTFRVGEHGALGSFLYYSLTSLTTVGFGDITPVEAFARNLTMFEAVLGQLFPAIILARILTLYADERKRVEETSDTSVSSSGNTRLS